MKRTLITSALPYANGFIHLGHAAGAYLPADVYARFLRLKGEEILYVCGSDEHGVAITIAAEKEKKTPKDVIDKYHFANLESFMKFGMSFDAYSRTSIDEHRETAREFFADMLEKDHLIQREVKQLYDNKKHMFLPDRYVEGECPNCGYDKARGDQCDKCGAYYDQLELKNPVSLVSGKKPVEKETTHWYMRFDKFQEFLENYTESHAKDWKSNVLQQTRSWLKQGLAERAITRDLKWGVPIDGLGSIPREKTRGKVLYVWFEAVLGYISATKRYCFEHSKKEDWKKWWQDEETRYVAFIGKDNIVFHTLIFPALLHAKGGYILPDNVPANEFLNLEGKKFSKSRNWSIDLRDFLSDFPEKNFVDTLRYTLAMNFPETRDSDFAWKDFQARNNNELSAIFGNFVNRTLQFISKYFKNKTPRLPENYRGARAAWNNLVDFFNTNKEEDIDSIKNKIPDKFDVDLEPNDKDLIFAIWKGVKLSERNYERFRFRDGLTETMNVARAANKYFNDEQPWKTVDENPEKCAKTLYFCVQAVRALATLFAPVTPYACRRIQRFFDFDPEVGESGSDARVNFWDAAASPTLKEELGLMRPSILFPKIEDSAIDEQIQKLKNSEIQESKPEEDIISIEDFQKISLKTAKVLSADKVKKSKKLLKLTVDLGGETRQILAGVAQHYSADDLEGKTLVVVANLKPAKLMGVESQGMALAASAKDGRLIFVTPEDVVEAGAEVR